MKLAFVFWFYKDVEVCRNRLELLQRYNPQLEIFALYGGRKSQSKVFRRALGKYVKDFYVSKLSEKTPAWKWINGDRMILDWYLSRGNHFRWDSVMVVQWDMLILGPIQKQFPRLKKEQIFLSGLRTLDTFIEQRWSWTKQGSRERKNYLAFQKYLQTKYGYMHKLLCSLFILQIFPRNYFQDWSREKHNTLGMLEYTLPTFARIFKTPIYRKNFGVWWFNKRTRRGETPMNARGVPIRKKFIERELRKKKGYRIFHPYFSTWS